jgi:hypothetical protein
VLAWNFPSGHCPCGMCLREVPESERSEGGAESSCILSDGPDKFVHVDVCMTCFRTPGLGASSRKQYIYVYVYIYI